jgi:hypothetical protein
MENIKLRSEIKTESYWQKAGLLAHLGHYNYCDNTYSSGGVVDKML